MNFSMFYKATKAIFFVSVGAMLFAGQTFAQTKSGKASTAPPAKNASAFAAPKVKQIDGEQLKSVLKTSARPLLVNFWATWCEPCREEFPDLVKIDGDYKNKIDFITVSLDDVEEMNTGVPKFLAEMKASMPAYLLTTPDEDAVISFVSKDWQGGLPFTILYGADGKTAYTRMGKVKVDVLRAEIEKLLTPAPRATTPAVQ